jgi:diguanylate cyclase (GGDEF)-like protein/PAS domain S-box-containing protein
VIATLYIGWNFVVWFTSYGESLERRALLVAASTAAASFDADDVASLKGGAGERRTQASRLARESLTRMREAIPSSRFAYLVAVRNGKVIFLFDAEKSTLGGQASASRVYTEESSVIRRVMQSKLSDIESPRGDRSGVWISALVPLLDPTSGKVVAVFGVDIGAQHWQAAITRYRWLGIGVAGFVFGIALLFAFLMFRQDRLASNLAMANRIVESGTTILFRLAADPLLPLTFISENVAKLGYAPKEFVDAPTSYRSLVHPDDEAIVEAFLRQAAGGTRAEAAQFRIRAKDGSYRWIENRMMPMLDAKRRIVAFEGMLIDINDAKLAEERVYLANSFSTAVLEMSPDGLLAVDGNNRLLKYNRRFLTMWKVSDADLASGDDSVLLAAAMKQLKDPKAFRDRIEYLYAHPDDTAQEEIETIDGRFIDRHTTAMRTDAGHYLGRVWFFRDVTARKNAEAETLRTSRHDVLTGLANRRVFVEEVQKSITLAKRDGKGFAVLYLDLDHFKDVNDTLGHPVGDLLLQQVAIRLQTRVRQSDTVARFGGDEFAVIQTGIDDPSEVAVLADALVSNISEPYDIQGNHVRIGASIGIATYGSDFRDAETLLSGADVALYRAKAEGRGTFRYFTDAMDAEVHDRVALGAELRQAIGSGQLMLMYQPQVDIETQCIVGVEALVRWNHPTRGLILPSAFVPLAETNGLIVALGRWVLQECCRQAKQWLDAGIAVPLIAVNVSGLQFKTSHQLENDIAAILAETGLPPNLLELELTESVLMTVSRDHSDVLARLRATGLRIAIDDFGTGYSSLEYLGRFPVNRVKIAQNFIFDLKPGSSNATIVRAAIALAHELKLDVVVEGVETAAQVALIRSWNCRKVQGYYFFSPLSTADATEALKAEMVAGGKPTPGEQVTIGKVLLQAQRIGTTT